MLNGYTDKELLDYLQQITSKSKNRSRLRMSDCATDGGWKICNTVVGSGVKNVRQAIINYIEERKRNYE
jgi:hypothetical protein